MKEQGKQEKEGHVSLPGSKQEGEIQNPFSFLDSLAGVKPTSLNNTESIEDKHLSVKIEDLEYKLEGFMERLGKVEDKLKELESKEGF